MNHFRFGAGLLATVVLSSANIAYSQELDGGAEGVTSDPSESIIGGPVKKRSFVVHNDPKSIIDANLQKQLDQLKANETIEVVIYLDVINDEDDAFDSSASVTYLENTNQISETEITTSDPDLNYAIEGLYFEDQLALIEERRAQHVETNRQRRIEKSKDKVTKLLAKLQKPKFDRLISLDESAGIVTVELRKNEIAKLARFPEYILSITLYSKDELNLESAFNNVRLNTTSWPVSSYGGQGAGIFMREGNNFCFEESDVDPIESVIGLGGGDYTEDRSANVHANRVAQSLRAASPRSHIYCSEERLSLPSAWKDQIHIVNYSWGNTGGASSTAWDSDSAAADSLSYNENVQLFVSTGNGCNDVASSTAGCEVGSPAKSHNALSVGAYDDTTDRIGNFSDWINPATGATKPEILAPGVNLQFAAGISNTSGTSYSTPLAAGMAASNISLMPGMKKHPALIKASMLAMATKNNIQDNGDAKVNGARGIRWNPDGWYTWWDQSHTFLNDASGQWKELKTYNLRAGENARIALSWSNRQEVCDGSANGNSYTPPSSRLCLELAMKVVDPRGRQVVYQNVRNRNWQAANFYTSVAGNYKVYVWRTAHYYEWTKKYFWSSKKYHYNRAKLGLRVTYIDNW